MKSGCLLQVLPSYNLDLSEQKCARMSPNQFSLGTQGSWALMAWTHVDSGNGERDSHGGKIKLRSVSVPTGWLAANYWVTCLPIENGIDHGPWVCSLAKRTVVT